MGPQGSRAGVCHVFCGEEAWTSGDREAAVDCSRQTYVLDEITLR